MAMKPEGHTETPWCFENNVIWGPDGHPVAVSFGTTRSDAEHIENMRFIVAAVNSYAVLQQANEKMREALEHIVSFGGQSLCGSPEATSANMAYDDCAEIARAALAEAGGEKEI